MSFSFYGGPKGQDFSITRVFNNRSNDLLEDLKMRWYSPVNVGDYVFISYGDIHAQDKYITGSDNNIIKVPSTFNKNLNIDLNGCGKTYNNSLWQKIYVDENKNVSPQFPLSDENVFVFLNISDEEEIIENFGQSNSLQLSHKVYNKNSILQVSCYGQKDGSAVILEEGSQYQVIYNETEEKDTYEVFITLATGIFNKDYRYQVIYKTSKKADIGYSLKESSQLYTDHTFGFGYRLIACLTGQTPQIDFRSEVRNIEDGEPGISIDTSIMERPKITFYQQKAQTINQVNSTVVSSENKPVVTLDTIYKGTKTNPVLDFSLPKAAQFFTGMLFGGGGLSLYSSSNSINGEIQNYLNALELNESIEAVKAIYNCLSINNSVDNNVNTNIFSFIQGTSISRYFFNNSSLYNFLNEVNENNSIDRELPNGFYGIEKNSSVSYLKELKNILDEICSNTSSDNMLSLNHNYWGNYGLITFNEFKNLSENEKEEYRKEYWNGAHGISSMYFLMNLIKKYIPIAYSKEFFNGWDETGHWNGDNSDLKNYILTIYKTISEDLQDHFDYVLSSAYFGDYYINIPTGKIYKFLKIDNNTLRVQYIGPLAGETPIVKTVESDSFIKNSEGEWEPNKVELLTNVSNGIAENNNFREEYTFKIPNIPNFSIGEVKKESNILPTVELKIADENNYKFDFRIPKGAKIHSVEYLTNFTTIPDNYSIGDYVLVTGRGPLQGNLYEVTEIGYSLRTNLRGPAGIAPTVGEIKIYKNSSSEKVSTENNIAIIEINRIYSNIQEIIEDFMDNNDFLEWLKKYIILDSDNLFNINCYEENSLVETYWGIYYKKSNYNNIIYGSLEGKTFFKFEDYKGTWLYSNNKEITLLIGPLNDNIICKQGERTLKYIYSSDSQTIDYSMNDFPPNSSEVYGKYITVSYTIKDKIEGQENIIYHSNGQNYYWDKENNKYTILENTDSINANGQWTISKLTSGGTQSIEILTQPTSSPGDNAVYSAGYINTMLENTDVDAKLVWKTLEDFIGGTN